MPATYSNIVALYFQVMARSDSEAPGGWGAENSEASPRTGPRGNSVSIASHWGGTLSV
jgi:hypothetical protein